MADWRDSLPPLRGKLVRDAPLAPFTWLRVGGPADLLFLPADEADLAALLAALPVEVPVTVLGVGSNVIIRDGGVDGVVVRLSGRAFAGTHVEPEDMIVAGAATLDAALARAAAAAGLAGLEFMAGIPGTVGGAVTMNAGCYGSDIRDVLVAAWGLDRGGAPRLFDRDSLGYGYRSSREPPDLIWTGAVFRGSKDDPAAITARMESITRRREETQPLRERTGGSTFKNPPDGSAWSLIDAAGWRGKLQGGAMFSPVHANFLINTGEASAADLERLGEAVREDVAARFGVQLEWEVRRIGRP